MGAVDDVPGFIERLFTQAPACYISWPAAAMVVGTVIGTLSSRAAGQLALVPRTTAGAMGIISAPFIHVGLAHLAANLPAFIVLGALVLRRGASGFPAVSISVALGQGVLLWLFGRKAAHVGMSGVIFGFFGYLVAVAWFTRTETDLLVAVLVVVLYGGILAGIAPARRGTSWDGHLLGLISGLGTAWLQYTL
jgi:membrane associated rhomboid family serine protease